MRPDLITCHLDTIRQNVNRQQKDVGLFEFGKVYWKAEDDTYYEEERLSIALTGNLNTLNWLDTKGQEVNFFILKSYVERILELLGIDSFQKSELKEDPYYSYGMKWHRGNQELASFGKVNNDWLQQFDVEQDVFIAEFSWEALVRISQGKDIIYKASSKYPSIERDLSLVLDQGVAYEEIKALVYSLEKELIKHFELFDVYEDEEQLGEGKKSYAVRMTFESYERTLKDKEIDQKMQKIIQSLKERLGAKLR
jgi:phenylalanyl-tRNA synthetase beta chain